MLCIFLIYIISNLCASDGVDERSKIQDDIRNERPIIGILSQKISLLCEYCRKSFTSYIANDSTYIAASYVKWIEGSGAQVIPILSTYPVSYTHLTLPTICSV